jgi:hypothetical protein
MLSRASDASTSDVIVAQKKHHSFCAPSASAISSTTSDRCRHIDDYCGAFKVLKKPPKWPFTATMRAMQRAGAADKDPSIRNLP